MAARDCRDEGGGCKGVDAHGFVGGAGCEEGLGGVWSCEPSAGSVRGGRGEGGEES